MRLHRLELVAFGPFADRQRIDFDELSRFGLFLLHGPTGAGKTTVLDAICFALYGRVPGVRGSVNRLRSDHAPDHVAPEVICEFSVSGRRFEVTRSPEWQRPKKRGTGTVRQHAHVVLRERIGTQWNPLTSRVDEAAEELQQLIGLGPEQFTKLILLPQGEFAAFLRATAEERRPLLQKLFGTDRFADVERWLADRRRECDHQVQAANATTARLFARAQEARLESVLDEDQPATAEETATLVAVRARDARSERAETQVEVRAAEHAYEAARRAADTAAEVLEQHRRRGELKAELDRLEAEAGRQEQRRAAVTAAGHARVLAPLLADLSIAERRYHAASKRWSQAQSAAEAAGEDRGEAGQQRRSALGAELGALTESLRAEVDLRQLDAQQLAGEREIEAAEHDLAAAEAEALDLAARQNRLSGERIAAELIAVTVASREQDAVRATTIAEAVLEQQRVAEAQAGAEDTLRAAIDVHQAAVDAVQKLRARRLDGMAAELAAGLSGDDSCPVCGSREHPAPATHRAPAVTDTDQQHAEAAQTAAEAGRERAVAIVQAGQQRSAALLAVTGGKDAETAASELAAAQERVVEARAAGTRVRRLTGELDALADQLANTRSRQATAEAAASAAREALAAIAARQGDLRARLEQARGDDVDLRARHRRLTRALETLTDCDTARQELTQAQERLARAGTLLDSAAAEAGFVTGAVTGAVTAAVTAAQDQAGLGSRGVDRAGAAAAVLPDAEVERLTKLVTEHDTQVARLRALLEAVDQDSPSDAGDQPDPAWLRRAEAELQRLRTVQEETRQAHELAQERHTLAGRSRRALTGLAAELEAHAGGTAPLRSRFAALDSVSRCVEGTGGDNTMRMRSWHDTGDEYAVSTMKNWCRDDRR